MRAVLRRCRRATRCASHRRRGRRAAAGLVRPAFASLGASLAQVVEERDRAAVAAVEEEVQEIRDAWLGPSRARRSRAPAAGRGCRGRTAIVSAASRSGVRCGRRRAAAKPAARGWLGRVHVSAPTGQVSGKWLRSQRRGGGRLRARPGSSSALSARPWWSPRTRRCCLSGEAMASTMRRTSPGKQAWSPVYSTTRQGCVSAPPSSLASRSRTAPTRWTASSPACTGARSRPRRSSRPRVAAPQRAELAIRRVEREVEAAQVGVGAPDVEDRRVRGDAAFCVARSWRRPP